MVEGDEMSLTVGMSAVDAERTIEDAVRSVQAQTHVDWRLIVLDDGSTDRTPAIIEALAREDQRIELVRGTSRLGLQRRLNEIIDRATGTFFARMDADDVCHPERFARQLVALRRSPEVDLLGSSMIILGRDGRPRGIRRAPTEHADICARPHAGFPLFHPTWLGRLAWFKRFRYATYATRCEDQELLLRAHETSRFANLAEPLLGYREDGLTWSKICTGRAVFASRATLEAWRRGHRIRPLAIAVEHGGRMLVEAVAIGTRSEDRLLRWRARPLAPEDVTAWEQALVRRPASDDGALDCTDP